MTIGYPWKTLPRPFELCVTGITLGSREYETSNDDRAERAVSVAALTDQPWPVVTIAITGELAADTEDRLSVPVDELVVYVVLHARRTNLRVAVPVRPLEDLTFATTVVASHNDVYGSAVLQAVVVSTTSGTENRELGSSESWTLDFDDLERADAGRAPFAVVWEPFDEAAGQHAILQSVKQAPFYFDLEASEPVLYLNESIPYFDQILNWNKAQTHNRDVRDLMAEGIATKVLVQIAEAVIADVEVLEGGGYALARESELLSAMLRELTSRIVTVGSEEELMRMIVGARESDTPEKLTRLRAEVVAAVEELCSTRATINRASDRAING